MRQNKHLPTLFSKLGVLYWGLPLLMAVFTSLILYWNHPWDNDMLVNAKRIVHAKFYHHIVYFFYYLTIQLLSGFSENVVQVYWTILVVLSIWAGLKTWLSVYYSGFQLSKLNLESIIIILSITSVGIVVALPVLLPGWYLGKMFPNIWHNPSISFTMPFCVIAFFSACAYLESPRIKSLVGFGIASVIILMSKPSFFFCLAPAFPLFCLIKYRFSKAFWWALLMTAGCGLILLAEIYKMYIIPIQNSVIQDVIADTSTSSAPATQITFGLFKLWKTWVGDSYLNILWSFLVSFVLPILYVILYPQHARNDLRFWFAVALSMIGVLLFSFVHHTGHSFVHGNFYWQNIPASYILYLMTLIGFIKYCQSNQYKVTWREIIFGLVYLLHIVSGLLYIWRLIFWGYYQ